MKKPISDKSGLFDRDPANFETDKAALEAIVQAAVNVELFTIPLYMTSMYSLQGVHQITGKKSKLYEGRLWPGLAPSFRPGSLGNIPENERAFNTIFSVFIEEMLHLQMASNLATSLGVTPEYTEMSPEAANYAWSCYGPEKTEIPYIVDFRDCVAPYDKIRVKLDSLTLEQNELFLAIEAPEAPEEVEPGQEPKVSAVERIKENADDRIHGYFPEVPFKGWEPGEPLPLFGTIGHMYQCLWDYMDIEYKEPDGRIWTLWEKMYQPAALQRDLFNTAGSSHPYREYPDLETTVSGWLPDRAKEVVFKLICGITDQGEGKGITKNIRPQLLTAVSPVNQSSDDALKADYLNYTDKGEPAPSSHAHARYENDKTDHYDRFKEIKDDLLSGAIVTWENWRADWPEKKGGKWLASDLMGKNYEENTYNLPPAEEVAGALNRLGNPTNADGSPDPEKLTANYKQFCQIATGAIAGITSVLNQYWSDSTVQFPFPSMSGSGDRLMMCWAVFGKVPDLSVGVEPRDPNVLYHACQGMNLNNSVSDGDQCGSAQIYHNCRGSNSCKAEGGCGFVQEIGKSASCGGSSSCSASLEQVKGSCGVPPSIAYSAPADNMCQSFGGCAVPISASQIYPDFTNTQGQQNVGAMELNDFVGPDYSTKTIPNDAVTFKSGDFVYDIAWEAFTKVLAARVPAPPIPEKPKTSDIRLAFPPST